MKFSLSWLKTHLETTASLDEITDTLTKVGLELEGVEDRAAALAPFVIAYVVEAVQHPNADRLRACKVDTGSGIVSVVCGAPNARTGMKAVFAELRTYLEGWKQYFRLAETPRVFRDLDKWIRHRLRMVQLKQWKRGRKISPRLGRWSVPASRFSLQMGDPGGRAARSSAESPAGGPR